MSVERYFLKVLGFERSVTKCGGLFHAGGPATAKSRSPRVGLTTSCCRYHQEDRRRYWPQTTASSYIRVRLNNVLYVAQYRGHSCTPERKTRLYVLIASRNAMSWSDWRSSQDPCHLWRANTLSGSPFRWSKLDARGSCAVVSQRHGHPAVRVPARCWYDMIIEIPS